MKVAAQKRPPTSCGRRQGRQTVRTLRKPTKPAETNRLQGNKRGRKETAAGGRHAPARSRRAGGVRGHAAVAQLPKETKKSPPILATIGAIFAFVSLPRAKNAASSALAPAGGTVLREAAVPAGSADSLRCLAAMRKPLLASALIHQAVHEDACGDRGVERFRAGRAWAASGAMVARASVSGRMPRASLPTTSTIFPPGSDL